MRFWAVAVAALAAIAVPAEEIALPTPAGLLHGTLLSPPSAVAVPVALIIAGSGPTDRDGNSPFGSTDSYRLLAQALESNGIASLRFDKRGVGASADAILSERDLRFETYVNDAVGWGELLLRDSRFTSLTLIGHSEGALIATLAAQRLPARSIVSIAGVGRPAGDVILEQLERQLSGSLLQRSREIVAALNAGSTVSNVPAELQSLFRPSVQPYLISWFRYDPALEIARLTVPALIVQGTSDIQVSTTDALLLARAAQNDSLVVIEGMNHVLKLVGEDSDAQTRSYTDPSLPIDESLVRVVTQFMKPMPRRRAVAR